MYLCQDHQLCTLSLHAMPLEKDNSQCLRIVTNISHHGTITIKSQERDNLTDEELFFAARKYPVMHDNLCFDILPPRT